MQSITIKKSVFLVLLYLNAWPLLAQLTDKQLLDKADSLFNEKQFTASMENYRLLMDRGAYTPQMLLKMAFIAENNGRTAEAMRYLNQYHIAHPNRAVFRKINALADLEQLRGYNFSDREYFTNLLQGYQYWILSVLFLLMAVLFLLMVQSRERKQATLPYLGFLCLLMLLVFLFTNFLYGKQSAILKPQTCFLMVAPSAGAPVLDKVQGGHRVTILGKEDIWYKVAWQGKEAYIRAQNVWLLKG